jgi:small subunit ribosomal protein S16
LQDRLHPAILNTWVLRVSAGGSVCILAIPNSSEFTLPGTNLWKGLNSVLMIRLARFGARKQPYYRVVVIEKDRARNGRSVEVVGTYNPRTTPATVDLKRERIEHWTQNGAQLSDRVAKLLAAHPPASAA